MKTAPRNPGRRDLAVGYRPMVNSSRFGEPEPGLVMWPVVALAIRALCTVAGLAVGWLARYSAAAPATCGVAIEVPLIVLVAVSLVAHDDVMPTPGAKMS